MAPVVGSAVVQAELRGTGEWLLRAKEQPSRYCNGVLKAALLSGVLSSMGVTRLLGGHKGKGMCGTEHKWRRQVWERVVRVISLGRKVLVSCWDGVKVGAS